MAESSSIVKNEVDGFTTVKSKTDKFLERYLNTKKKTEKKKEEKFNIAKRKLQESILPEDWKSRFGDSDELVLLQWYNINPTDKDFDAEKHLIHGFFPSKLIFNSFDGTPTIQNYLTDKFKDDEEYSFTIFTDKKHPKRIKYLKIIKKRAKKGFQVASQETLNDCWLKLKNIIVKDWETKLNDSLSDEINPKTYSILYTFSRKKPTDEDYEDGMINGVFIFDIFFKAKMEGILLIDFLKEFFKTEGLDFFTMQDKHAERKTTHICIGIPRQALTESPEETEREEPEEHEDQSFDIGSSADFPAMS